MTFNLVNDLELSCLLQVFLLCVSPVVQPAWRCSVVVRVVAYFLAFWRAVLCLRAPSCPAVFCNKCLLCVRLRMCFRCVLFCSALCLSSVPCFSGVALVWEVSLRFPRPLPPSLAQGFLFYFLIGISCHYFYCYYDQFCYCLLPLVCLFPQGLWASV